MQLSMFVRRTLAVFALGLCLPQAASATVYYYCVVQDYSGQQTRYISDLKQTEVDKIDEMKTGFAYVDEVRPQLGRDYPGRTDTRSYCTSSTNGEYIQKNYARLLSENPDVPRLPFNRPPVISKPVASTGLILSGNSSPQPPRRNTATQPPVNSEAEAELARTRAREQREAEFQAKLAAHEAGVAEYQRKVAAREAEIARQQEELAADAAAAAREKATHARLLEEHMKRQMDYEAARNRHTLCVNGNQEACAEIAAGKPATGEQLADAGEASTDADANRCVTTAEVRTNATFKGNTAASVLNGCGQKVDVRICLMRTGGWDCGVVWGVGPQAKASHSSFNATGEVFVDARVSGSDRPLARPGGK